MKQANSIKTGDLFDVVPQLPDESIHAVVTDPPYGLAFMGRDWDDFEPREYQGWCEEWAREVKRVLKPGGHLLAFSGNRTHHRLFTGVEDAGFEIRDTLTWHYGCLSEDTEVLTPDGWKEHDEIEAGDSVMAFDPDTEQFNVEETNRVFRYEHDGSMVRYQSPHTDQLVTPNHRVLHRERSEWKTTYAMNLYGSTELPVIHGERKNTSERTGRDGVDSLCKVRRNGVVSTGPSGRTELLFSGVLPELPEGGCGYVRTLARDSGQRTRRVDRGNNRVGSGENERREQSSVEGWRNGEEAERELQAGDSGTVPGRVRGNGASEWLRTGTSVEGSKEDRATAHVGGSGTSQGPRQSQQRYRESGTVAEQSVAQTGRGGPGGASVRTTLAQTSRVDYTGIVWCVQVPSSYFVARRNGQVFITGNSGFPKATDVSKTIDKRADAEREVVATREADDVTSGNYGQGDSIDEDKQGERTTYEYTEPATEQAKQWDGWKTGLKPATEYIVMARKPFDGATVDCVLEHGTGALNIDGCRIETDGDRPKIKHTGEPNEDSLINSNRLEPTATVDDKTEADGTTTEGRYPSNVVFDATEAERLDRQVGECSTGNIDTDYEDEGTHIYGNYGERHVEYNGDSGGPSRYFYTSKASKSERTENGSIDNSHPTVKPQDLMEWLIKMVSREDQLILDPFCGSGTTCKAAKSLNRQFIGIEKQAKWADVARVRCNLTPDDPSVVRDDSAQEGLEAYND